MALRVVTLKRAGELLGGDKPLSVRTISAMITRGDLEPTGARKTRRVTERSIESYQRGIPWRDARNQSSDSDASEEPATLGRRRTGHGPRSIHDTPKDGTPDAVSIHAHLPKHGLIRS